MKSKKGLHQWRPQAKRGLQPGVWGWNSQQPGTKGVWGRSPQPPPNFYRFYIKNTLIFTHFFTEKGLAVSAVTMDDAKIFSQLMSTSRNLAKVSENRLQPSLVWKIIAWKLGFSTLLQGQRGRHGTVPPPPPPYVPMVFSSAEFHSSTKIWWRTSAKLLPEDYCICCRQF